MTTDSPWPRPPAEPFPPLHARLEVDAAIIGAGITGLTTALRLTDEGLRVAVLEAGRVGDGNSGRAGGGLCAAVEGGLAALRRSWGAEVVAEVVAARMDAIGMIEETAKRLSLDCDFQRLPWQLHRLSDGDDGALEGEWTAARAAGLEATLVERPPFPLPVARALRIRGQAQLQPLAYLVGLAASHCGGNCRIFEHTRVTGIDAEHGLVRTERADLRARHIVMATGTPKGLSLAQAEMEVRRWYGITAGDAALPEGLHRLLDEGLSLRRYRRGDGAAGLLIRGEGHATGHGGDPGACFRPPEDLARRLGTVPEGRWSAQSYRPADGLPYIGPGPGSDRLYLATGYSGDGLVYGTLAAMIISDLVVGRPDRWSRLFSPRRFTPVKSARRVLKENLNVAEHLLRDHLPGGEAGSIEAVAPGEGRRVTLEGEKLAVHRGRDGRLQVVSAVCPHLRCMVRWNSAEQSWDCPCHGSRFRPDGSVIEGPALSPLPARAPRR